MCGIIYEITVRSLASRFVCSCNPRGLLKLWKLSDPLASAASSASEADGISLVAEFSSCFGMRIMCVDASAEDEVDFSYCYVSVLYAFLFLSTPIQLNEELRTQL